ncbi:hypothetical protein BGY98DRAFT_961442 [Russula aff. rugulosa BPL654]|nr:hypothetical protein BGY98DRAFT_961442 [Russula aff. rugulosa BPL654]
MRRYDIVSGILLILSTINFAIAAPVLVQEKRRAWINVEHIPRGVITVLEKRGLLEEVGKLVEYFKTLGQTTDESAAHASSSSASLGLDHDSTNVVQAPARETSYLNPLVSDWGWVDALADHESMCAHPTSTDDDFGSYHELAGEPVHPSTSTDGSYGPYQELAGAPAPNPQSKDPNFDGDKINFEEPPEAKRLKQASSEESGQTGEYQVEQIYYYLDEQGPPKRQKLESSNEFTGSQTQAPENQVMQY